MPTFASLSLSSHRFPGRFAQGPSALCLRGPRFALVMGWKPEDSFAQVQRAHRRTIGTLHCLYTTVQEPLWRDLHPTHKRAFERIDGWYLISYEVAAGSTLNPCCPACALMSGRGCRHRFDPICRLRGRRLPFGRSGWLAEQSLQFLLALCFRPLYFVLSCASLHFHTDPLVRLQGMPGQRLDG